MVLAHVICKVWGGGQTWVWLEGRVWLLSLSHTLEG